MGEHKNFYKKAANEAIGTKTKYRRKKGLRIWNEEIRNVIANKRTAYQIYLQNPSEENFETYKIRRNIAKTIVSKTHKESWDRFISRIETDIFGEQSMAYKVLKHLNRTNKDTIEINNIEDQKWINHYKDLWCTNSLQNDNDDPETTSATSTGIDEISDEELEQSLKSMKNRKAPGPDGLNSELFKYGGPVLSNRLLKLINKCWKKRSTPEEWGQARVKSLFKKGKRDDCSNYRGISLLNSGCKIYANIITQRLKPISEAILLEEQNGFRRGRSCIDNVFTLKQTIEKRREFNLETHMAFLDLEKAFDRVNRNQLWQILNRRGIPYHLIEVIKSLYKNTSVQIDTGRKILDKIYINQGVRQGCNLSPLLINIYIDDLLRNWKHKVDTGIMLKW